jgi:hypothetical protein
MAAPGWILVRDRVRDPAGRRARGPGHRFLTVRRSDRPGRPSASRREACPASVLAVAPPLASHFPDRRSPGNLRRSHILRYWVAQPSRGALQRTWSATLDAEIATRAPSSQEAP